MSMNKAIHQVIMHEQIGGNKQAPSQPTKPVKMPEAPRPAGSPPKRITGVNAPPPKRPIPFPFPGDTTKEIQPKPIRPGTGSQPRPIPASGGAEVTPPEGLPESMKAFWKQRIGNQLIEKKELGVMKKALAVGKAVLKWMPPGPDDLIGKGIDVYSRHVDDEFVRQTHDLDNPESPYYYPDRDPWRDLPIDRRPQKDSNGNYHPGGIGGGWAGGNVPDGGGSVVV